MPSGARLVKKQAYGAKLMELVQRYPQILIVHADNVGSSQLAKIRVALRGKAIILMGKNTTIRTIFRKNMAVHPQLEKLLPLVKSNIGFVFCEVDAGEVRKIILEHKVPAPARQGVMAPVDVHIPAGPTGMDPGTTSFFQALGISTKIVKGQIEIQNDVQLITQDTRVSASAATLLQKLNIRPFSYGLKVLSVYDDGSVYDSNVLDLTDDAIISLFQSSANQLAAFSLQLPFPTAAALPHAVREAFKNCVALVMDSDYSFKEMEEMKSAIASGPVAAGVPAAASGGGKAAAKKEEPEEEEEEEADLGFSLFD
eukprot:GHVT01089275.1.p2 GENE.GHVT01089275.1~~GHVT01089275.1.p2  ORF type:complete len:312 (-),score=77.13 GHVT01089275.1:497-1432(-)